MLLTATVQNLRRLVKFLSAEKSWAACASLRLRRSTFVPPDGSDGQAIFHKRSNDGSAKCNAFKTGVSTDAVIGAVYELPKNEKPALDRAEGVGRGYHEETVRVLSPQNKEITVYTYIADAAFIDNSLKPYSWYEDFVLAGAEEHRLPLAYVETRVRAVHAIRDPDARREQARRAEIKP